MRKSSSGVEGQSLSGGLGEAPRSCRYTVICLCSVNLHSVHHLLVFAYIVNATGFIRLLGHTMKKKKKISHKHYTTSVAWELIPFWRFEPARVKPN